MKISKKKNSKLILFSLLATVVVAFSGYTIAATSFNLWPFQSKDKEQEDKAKKEQKNTDKSTEKNLEGDSSDTETDQTNEDEVDTNVPPAQEAPVSQAPPLENPPAVSDPYPIRNERYQIAQLGENSFRITLYPLQWDYDAQLREFKYDALKYLEQRYGNTQNLNIEWNPDNAKDI